MVDSIYRTRSLGVAAEGLPDQYADGKAAKVWEYYIGCRQTRTSQYKSWLSNTLREKGCKTVLDVACGTGIDSIILLEEGFEVMSTDASDKMLKYALKERWARRKDPAFDKWVIEEANWLTLVDDLEDVHKPEGGFDAVICLGNSFAHLPDFEGTQIKQKTALANFGAMVRPGGLFIVDHRNYDAILESGSVPAKNVYYNSLHVKDIQCSNLYVNSEPRLTTLDYTMDMGVVEENGETTGQKLKLDPAYREHKFRLSYFPHTRNGFTNLLVDTFPKSSKHEALADFGPIDKAQNPAYFIHIMQKPDKKE